MLFLKIYTDLVWRTEVIITFQQCWKRLKKKPIQKWKKKKNYVIGRLYLRIKMVWLIYNLYYTYFFISKKKILELWNCSTIFWWIYAFWDVMNTIWLLLKNISVCLLSACMRHKFCDHDNSRINSWNFHKFHIYLEIDINWCSLHFGAYHLKIGTTWCFSRFH